MPPAPRGALLSGRAGPPGSGARPQEPHHRAERHHSLADPATLPGREGRRRPRLAQGWAVGIDGRVKPSWRTAWSVGPTERVRRPAPWLWLVVGRSDPLRVLRIQGTASGQQDD